MYAVCTSFILLITVVYTNAAVALIGPQDKPLEFANQDGCYVESLNRVIPYNGEYFPKGSCSKYTCHDDNVTQIVTCGTVDFQEDIRCILISNKEADYPDCCPFVMCRTIPPEYLKELQESTDSQRSIATEGPNGPPEEPSNGVGTTGLPVLEEFSENVVPAPIEVKSLGESLNELLIAQANSNVGG